MIILFSPLCLCFSSFNLFLFFFVLLSALFLFVFSCPLHLFSCFWYYDCITTRSWTRQDQWQAWVSSPLRGAQLLQWSPLESPMWSFLSSSDLFKQIIKTMHWDHLCHHYCSVQTHVKSISRDVQMIFVVKVWKFSVHVLQLN